MRATLVPAFALVFAVTLAASVVLAQTAPLDGAAPGRLVSFGLGGGVSVPVSDAGDAFKNGFAGQGFVRFNLRQLPVAPRLDFTFSRFDLDAVQISTPGVAPTGTGQLLAGLGSLQLPLVRSGAIRPYLVAGVGAYRLETEVDASGAYAGDSESSTRFGVNGGAGVLFRFGSAVSGYVEGRVDNVFTEKGVIDSDQIQVVPVTFGLVF